MKVTPIIQKGNYRLSMSFIDGVFNFFGRGSSQAAGNSTSIFSTFTRLFNNTFNKTNAGVIVGPEDSLQLSAYWLAVRAISEDVAKLPLRIVIKEDNDITIVKDNPLLNVLTRGFNPFLDSMSGIETLVRWMLTFGNAYAEVLISTTGKMEWFLIHPTRVLPLRQKDGSFKYRITFEQDQAKDLTVIWPASKILHLKGPGEGEVGLSVGQIAAESLGIATAAQNFTGAFFGNNLSIGAALETEKALDATTKSAIRKEWKEKFGGSNKAYEMAILDRGFKFNRLQMNSTDAELLATRKFQVEEIARWFRIPLHKLMDMSKSTFNNVEQQDINYSTDTISPWVRRLEVQLSFRFLTGNKMVEIDEKALSRGDMKARAAFYKEMRFNLGVMTGNQIAELEGLPKYDGGEIRWMPLNVADAELANESMLLDIEIKKQTLEGMNEPETTEETTPEETEEDKTEEETQQENNTSLTQDGAISAFIPVMHERLNNLIKKENNAHENADKKKTPVEIKEYLQRFYIRFETELQEFLMVQFNYLCKVADKRAQTKGECLQMAQQICAMKKDNNLRPEAIVKMILNKLSISEKKPTIGDIKKCEDGKYYKYSVNGWRLFND